MSLNGAFALGGAAVIYALFNVLIREMSLMYGDQAQIVARYSVALLIVIGLQFFWYKKSIRIPKNLLWRALLLGLQIATVVFLITTAVNNTKIANAVFLIWAGSIFMSFLLGTFLLKEKITTNKIVALILVVVGLSMFAEGLAVLSIGLVAGFFAGVFDGVANTLRKSLKELPRNTVMIYQYSVGLSLLVVFMLTSGNDIIREASLYGAGITVIYGILLALLGNLLLYGFQHFDVNIGTIILASEIMIAIAFGYLFFGEIPTSKELIGGIAIFLASIVTVINIKTPKLKS